MLRGLLFAGLLAALAFTLSNADVRSEPLDAATCGQLKGEQARMEQSGVRGSMEKGPQWAKANLAADKLDQIRRLMDLDEQLIFRCSSRNLIELPPEADADPPPPKTDEEGKDAATPKADAAPVAKGPVAEKAPAEKKSAPTKAKSSETKTAPAAEKVAPAPKKQDPAKAAAPPPEKAAAAKPKPKPKSDDAYKAPQVDPKVNPFANQPARQ